MSSRKSKSIAAIILAAGESARMGRAKQAIDFCGETLLRRACHAALAAQCSPVVVVLGANSEFAKSELLDLTLNIAFNQEWPEGISTSIRCGINALLDSQCDADAALLMLADQPLITATEISLLKKRFGAGRSLIAASEYQSQSQRVRGVPALFASQLFPNLQRLTGVKGAKSVINQYERFTTFVNMPQAAFDIDTRQDLEVAQAAFESSRLRLAAS